MNNIIGMIVCAFVAGYLVAYIKYELLTPKNYHCEPLNQANYIEDIDPAMLLPCQSNKKNPTHPTTKDI